MFIYRTRSRRESGFAMTLYDVKNVRPLTVSLKEKCLVSIMKNSIILRWFSVVSVMILIFPRLFFAIVSIFLYSNRSLLGKSLSSIGLPRIVVWLISLLLLRQRGSQQFNKRYYLQLLSGKDDCVKNRISKSNDYWLCASFSQVNRLQYRRAIWNLT